ncbi:Dolichol kinase sec59 [Madurella mycetomatis]|uniref:dolichol kinase n=1 Tax=Madurella mycetomatis TaxID=100816 RepID=A0A175W3Q2_9PEZI|nr:Dolichol kinase sec59 [Madurella mycetomatis]
MPEHLQPSPGPTSADSVQDHDHDSLRIISRSPHPYHRQSSELLEPSDRLVYRPSITEGPSVAPSHPFPSFAQDSTPASESGTEADDEHFLKGLPAPKARLHKGLRYKNEELSGTSTPLLSPAVLEEEGRKKHLSLGHDALERDKRRAAERARRRRELIRRATEVLLLVCQGGMIASNPQVQPLLHEYRKELFALGGLFCSVAAAYPLRLVTWAYRQGRPSKLVPIRIPATFDPAPLLYPPLVPVFVSLLIAENVREVVLPTMVLSICALPRTLIPGARYWECYSCSHWLLSCLPLMLDGYTSAAQNRVANEIPREALTLLYPLHQTLCLTLQHLTTTSLLVSELQLLSVGLVDLLLLARSPQAIILKAVLWGGGVGLIVSCSQVIRWGISLARVPKWRFRRVLPSAKNTSGLQLLRQLLSFGRPRSDSRVGYGSAAYNSGHSSDEQLDIPASATFPPLTNTIQADSISDTEVAPATLSSLPSVRLNFAEPPSPEPPARRHTLPATGGKPAGRSKTSTPAGRRKRATSSTIRAYFSLTQGQATLRKWLYALYVYLCILAVIFVGVRAYVQRYALQGAEPVGWALGYLFGDLPQFRFQVVKANLERWICLPPRSSRTCQVGSSSSGGGNGWVQQARLAPPLGAANTRLALSAYWLAILVTGLAVVFRLSPVYEVDTRRKVFHFMMVAMLLPATYVDPAYVALALALMLAIFLLLDLLRASQLPPLSRPVARFLTPYVDGRDLRGPVVISHIFLLVGCAVPLWLSLASLGRVTAPPGENEERYDIGWELPTREVSMVSGVVCVGLGDAAASLIGRRWGHRKWMWGGGKSIEGSVAFAVAVWVGLMAGAGWLRLGGWTITTADAGNMGGDGSGWESLMNVLDLRRLWEWARWEGGKSAVCASLASLTEAVLTGGNDNVVVPVVLWACVKSLRV